MTSLRPHLFCLLATAAVAAPVHADERPRPGILGWSGSVSLGYTAASGNSDNANFNGEATARRDWLQWAIEGSAEGRLAESNGVRSEENYAFALQGERKLTDISYLFAAADYKVDNFSGYDYQATQTVGYGRTLYDANAMKLSGQFGVGLRESETSTGVTETEPVAIPELDYSWDINERVTFTQGLKATIGGEYSVLESETGFKSDLTDALFLKASYEVIHTTSVPAGRDKTDTFTGVSVGYAF